MLRAVISTAELAAVTVGVNIRHVGPNFPDELHGESGVLVEISLSEANANWLTGFYRLEVSASDFDEKLRTLPPPPQVLPTRASRQKSYRR